MKELFFILFATCSIVASIGPSNEVVVVSSSNLDSILASNEFVFINFYADWCRFSNMLAPIWEDAAAKIGAQFPGGGKVVIAKVDCDTNAELGTRFHITKYPTLKYVQNGIVAKKEYRGSRKVEDFLQFVTEQLKDPVVEVQDINVLNNLDDEKRHLIGYFESKGSPDYNSFRRIASNLKDDCVFHASIGQASAVMRPGNTSIITYRSSKAKTSEDDETFKGNLQSYDEISIWSTDKCTPLVRDITFENAEELTEEGLPFLILFYAPGDTESIKIYTDMVQRELLGDKQNVNFLIADGVKFAHPLHHLGKSKEDLPLIAIDSFRHMYLLPNFSDMHVPGKMKQFLSALYSGKLHREFHYGPDESTTDDSNADSDNNVSDNEVNVDDKQKRAPSQTPPPSQFQHLGPSRNRYTLLHDEF